MYKFKIGTEVQGADYIQGNLVSIAEGKIIKRKIQKNQNNYPYLFVANIMDPVTITMNVINVYVMALMLL